MKNKKNNHHLAIGLLKTYTKDLIPIIENNKFILKSKENIYLNEDDKNTLINEYGWKIKSLKEFYYEIN